MNYTFCIEAENGIDVFHKVEGTTIKIVAKQKKHTPKRSDAFSYLLRSDVHNDDEGMTNEEVTEIISNLHTQEDAWVNPEATSNRSTKITQRELGEIMKIYPSTPLKAIAEKYHISFNRIKKILLENGVNLRRHGEKIGVHHELQEPIIEEDDVVTIQEILNTFESIDKIFEDTSVPTLLRLYYTVSHSKKCNLEELSKDFKLPVRFLQYALGEFDEFVKNLILKMYQIGYSVDNIAGRLKKSSTFVCEYLPDALVTEVSDQIEYTSKPLGEEEKEKIKKMFHEGMSLSEISDKFLITLDTVRRYALS